MLDKLPGDIIGHILTFCTPVDWREVKCVNKALHLMYTGLFITTPLQGVTIIQKYISDNNILIDGIVSVRTMQTVLKYIMAIGFKDKSPTNICNNTLINILIHYKTDHWSNPIDIGMVILLDNYINTACSCETVVDSYTLTNYIRLRACYSRYSTNMLEKSMYKFGGIYFRNLVKHLPDDIKLMSTMLLVNYHSITIYTGSKDGKYYYNDNTSIFDDIQFMHIDYFIDVDNICKSFLKFITQKLYPNDEQIMLEALKIAITKQKQRDPEEVYRSVLNAACESEINDRLEKLYIDREKSSVIGMELLYYKNYIWLL